MLCAVCQRHLFFNSIPHHFYKTKILQLHVPTCAKEIYYKIFILKIKVRIEFKNSRLWHRCLCSPLWHAGGLQHLPLIQVHIQTLIKFFVAPWFQCSCTWSSMRLLHIFCHKYQFRWLRFVPPFHLFPLILCIGNLIFC